MGDEELREMTELAHLMATLVYDAPLVELAQRDDGREVVTRIVTAARRVIECREW